LPEPFTAPLQESIHAGHLTQVDAEPEYHLFMLLSCERLEVGLPFAIETEVTVGFFPTRQHENFDMASGPLNFHFHLLMEMAKNQGICPLLLSESRERPAFLLRKPDAVSKVCSRHLVLEGAGQP